MGRLDPPSTRLHVRNPQEAFASTEKTSGISFSPCGVFSDGVVLGRVCVNSQASSWAWVTVESLSHKSSLKWRVEIHNPPVAHDWTTARHSVMELANQNPNYAIKTTIYGVLPPISVVSAAESGAGGNGTVRNAPSADRGRPEVDQKRLWLI